MSVERPSGHDYYGRGTYLITLVVSGREGLLSHLTGTGSDALKGDNALTLTPLGEKVEQAYVHDNPRRTAPRDTLGINNPLYARAVR